MWFSHFVFVLLFLVTNCKHSSFEKNEHIHKDLDAAIRLISRVKSEIPIRIYIPKAMDCSDLRESGVNKNGMHVIWPINRLLDKRSIPVLCDMIDDGGGWTVLSRKTPDGRLLSLFNQSWQNYKMGFNFSTGDYWIGNDVIFMLTNQRLYTARFVQNAQDFKRRYISDCVFWIDDESNQYTAHIANCTGILRKSILQYDKSKFSTFDRDNDLNLLKHCAKLNKRGWWFSQCTREPPNYEDWQTNGKSIPWSMIKIRPTTFKKQK